MGLSMGVCFICKCIFKTLICSCDCCEPPDRWKIDEEVWAGERGAGFLYKRGKSAAVWSKRFITLDDTKLRYYMERDRMVCKGEIVLAGSSAQASASRASKNKKHYFSISHPECGTREFYAKTKNRQMQWVERINDISTEISKSAVYGKLLKQGGLRQNSWQERWCICAGGFFDYFEDAKDNQPKGSIKIIGASIREFTQKGKFCFEISVSSPGKKGLKKYVFQVAKEHDRDHWCNKLRRMTNAPGSLRASTASEAAADAEAGSGKSGVVSLNPLHGASGDDNDDNGSGNGTSDVNIDALTDAVGGSSSVRSSRADIASVVPELKEGYLQKLSPAMLKGWQKRYFKTKESGDIVYYKSEEDARKGADEKGTIVLTDIMFENGVEYNEESYVLSLSTHQGKKIQLKAASREEGAQWADNIEAWFYATAAKDEDTAAV